MHTPSFEMWKINRSKDSIMVVNENLCENIKTEKENASLAALYEVMRNCNVLQPICLLLLIILLVAHNVLCCATIGEVHHN